MPSILVLEPPSPARDDLVQALGAAGHRVTPCQDGEEAWRQWREHRHDLLILADESATPSGLFLAGRIKAEAGIPFLPIVLLHSTDEPAARVAALAEVEDVVLRPYVPGELAARAEALLRTRRLVDQLRTTRVEGEVRALSDSTTGLRSRAFLLERLTEEWKRSVRYNEPLSFLVLSVDAWTKIVARRGPAFADRVLHALGAATLRALRQIDVVARFGPSEVAALLPNTHFAGSLTCAERLRREIGGVRVEDYAPSATLGLAFYPGKDVSDQGDLQRLAVRALERARDEGPGNICLIQHQGYLFQPS